MRTRVILTLLAVAFLSAPALADEVQLKNGKTVKGLILLDKDDYVMILTADGKRVRIRRSEIALVAETAEIGNEAIDARLAEIDAYSPGQLFEVAKWAKDEGKEGWRLVARMGLRLDPDHEDINLLLGNIKVGDTWYDNKREADKARKEHIADEMKEKGYVRWRGGWISTEDKALASKDPDAFILDEETDTWRDKATVMQERGYTLVGGKWVKAGTEQDKTDMERFRQLTGEDIWVITTPHFRIFAQQYPPDQVQEFGELVEKVYAWFLEAMNKPADFPLFRGQQAHLWILKDKNAFLEWLKHYKNRYSLSDDWVAHVSKGAGNMISGMLGVTTCDQSRDIKNELVHQTGHFLIWRFSPGLNFPAWLGEAVAHQCEHVHCGNGTVNCSTMAKYDASGGVAQKDFSTKDAKDRAKGMIREGSDEPFETLNKIELNSLTGDHLAKGWTIIDWLWGDERAKLVEWLEARNTTETVDALKKVFGWDASKLDKEWARKIKKG